MGTSTGLWDKYEKLTVVFRQLETLRVSNVPSPDRCQTAELICMESFSVEEKNLIIARSVGLRLKGLYSESQWKKYGTLLAIDDWLSDETEKLNVTFGEKIDRSKEILEEMKKVKPRGKEFYNLKNEYANLVAVIQRERLMAKQIARRVSGEGTPDFTSIMREGNE